MRARWMGAPTHASWSMFELLSAPHEEKLLVDEVKDKVLDVNHVHGILDLDHKAAFEAVSAGLPYTKAIVSEVSWHCVHANAPCYRTCGGGVPVFVSLFHNNCLLTPLLCTCPRVLPQALRLHPSVAKDVKYAVGDDILPDGTKVS